MFVRLNDNSQSFSTIYATLESLYQSTKLAKGNDDKWCGTKIHETSLENASCQDSLDAPLQTNNKYSCSTFSVVGNLGVKKSSQPTSALYGWYHS